jgi:hypothetical protein
LTSAHHHKLETTGKGINLCEFTCVLCFSGCCLPFGVRPPSQEKLIRTAIQGLATEPKTAGFLSGSTLILHKHQTYPATIKNIGKHFEGNTFYLGQDIKFLGEEGKLHFGVFTGRPGGYGVFWFGDSDPDIFYITKNI